MPALPSSIIEPIWDQCAALLPVPEPAHPLGCHRPRIPDRIVFDSLIPVLAFGCAYWRIADITCSATTLRRRRDEWIAWSAVIIIVGRLVREAWIRDRRATRHHRRPCDGPYWRKL